MQNTTTMSTETSMVEIKLVQLKDNVENQTIKESIVLFGFETDLLYKVIRYLIQVMKPNQSIYILTPTKIKLQHPNVLNVVCEPGLWVMEITNITNIKVIYSFLVTDQSFQIYHNINIQIGLVAKALSIDRFVLLSKHDVSETFRKIFKKSTKVRKQTEHDLIQLGLKNLIIIRPGPMISFEIQHARFKHFSIKNCIENVLKIIKEPYYLMRFNTVNCSKQVGKTCALTMLEPSTDGLPSPVPTGNNNQTTAQTQTQTHECQIITSHGVLFNSLKYDLNLFEIYLSEIETLISILNETETSIEQDMTDLYNSI